MINSVDLFDSAGRNLAKYAGLGILQSRKAQQEAAEAAATQAAKSGRAAGVARRVAKGVGIAGGLALGALGIRRGAQAGRAALARGRNAKLVADAKNVALRHRVAKIPDASLEGSIMGSGPYKRTRFKKPVPGMANIDNVAINSPYRPYSVIKKTSQSSASNRMSQALAAVRTKSGALGSSNSVGRVAGAPSVVSPSMQGVPKATAASAPNLGFPKISKPPRV